MFDEDYDEDGQRMKQETPEHWIRLRLVQVTTPHFDSRLHIRGTRLAGEAQPTCSREQDGYLMMRKGSIHHRPSNLEYTMRSLPSRIVGTICDDPKQFTRSGYSVVKRILADRSVGLIIAKRLCYDVSA